MTENVEIEALPAPAVEWVIHPMVKKAQRAFLRDFDEMLRTNFRQWVAYHGDERVGFANDKFPLFEECRRRGMPREEIIVQCVEPELDVENIIVD